MSQVQAIPAGFHTATPYLIVKGAQKAIAFYKRAFGAEEVNRHGMAGTDQIMHAQLRIGDSMIMLADEFPDHGCLGPAEDRNSPVAIHLYVENVDALYERAVAAGATPTMPVMDAFWGDRFGKLKDPFGHEWSLATHTEDLTPEQVEERAKTAFC